MSAEPRTLFVGRGANAVGWYRCTLPAMALGHDWVSVAGEPGAMSLVSGSSFLPFERWSEYEVVVVSLPKGKEWLRGIRALQAAGVTVLFEVDDDLRSVRKMEGHDFRKAFDKRSVEAFELCLRACDGAICSTEFLARRYRSINPRAWVCRNGLDLKRYELTRPARSEVAIGWAGATGHRDSALPWVREVGEVMAEHQATRFVSVGQPFAEALVERHGRRRCMSVPFTFLETYPAAMTLFDVALAPAGKGNFFRGKSDLRWLEASALGIPVIADPDVYPEIEHGMTGFHASTPGEMREILSALVVDEARRVRVGEAARAHVREHRDIRVAAQRWAEVLREAATLREPALAARA